MAALFEFQTALRLYMKKHKQNHSESYLFIELLPVTSGSGEAFSDDTRQSSEINKMN